MSRYMSQTVLRSQFNDLSWLELRAPMVVGDPFPAGIEHTPRFTGLRLGGYLIRILTPTMADSERIRVFIGLSDVSVFTIGAFHLFSQYLQQKLDWTG